MGDKGFSFEIKEKGRVVLPAGFRRVCGFEVGAELVAVPLGPGRALLETRDAAIQAIWSSQCADAGIDAVEDLQRARATEVEAFEERVAAPASTDNEDEESVQKFIASLGL